MLGLQCSQAQCNQLYLLIFYEPWKCYSTHDLEALWNCGSTNFRQLLTTFGIFWQLLAIFGYGWLLLANFVFC